MVVYWLSGVFGFALLIGQVTLYSSTFKRLQLLPRSQRENNSHGD